MDVESLIKPTAAALRIAGAGVLTASIAKLVVEPYTPTSAQLLYACGTAQLLGAYSMTYIYAGKDATDQTVVRATKAAVFMGEMSRVFGLLAAVNAVHEACVYFFTK